MKTIIAIAALTTIGATSLAAQQPAPAAPAVGRGATAQAERPAAKFKHLTRAELDDLLKDPSKVVIVDVRRPDELTTNGGFGAYLNIQLADLEKYLAYIPKDRAVVTVSNNSSRAGRAAELLGGKGFKVAGGIGALEYEKAGGTLVKTPAPAPAATTTAASGAAPAAATAQTPTTTR